MKKQFTPCITGLNRFALPQRFLFLFLLMLFSELGLAQGILVSGVVRDAKKNPLIGVTLTLKGTTEATSTDANGHYSITVPDTKTVLIFSNVGFLNIEELVGD